MVSAVLFTALLEYSGSPVHQFISNGAARRALIGLAMGSTAIALIYSLAFFLADTVGDEALPEFNLKMGVGLRDRNTRPITPGDPLDLTFLNWKRDQPYLFFERTRYRLDAVSGTWAPSVRRSIEDLDLTYYLPCVAHGRTVAFLGVSRTADGDFLSSVDLNCC